MKVNSITSSRVLILIAAMGVSINIGFVNAAVPAPIVTPKKESIKPDLVIQPKKIDQLIKKTLPNTSVGIVVMDAVTGKTLYERRADEAFPPASTTKLFSAAAALLKLGSNYEFITQIKAKKPLMPDGKLMGNIYVQFSGDPSLTIEDLQQLIADLKANGIHSIDGDVVIDNSRFQKPNYALGWSSDSLVWYFAPPITSVILNENKIALSLTSNQTMGALAQIALAPEETIKIPIQSDLVTVTNAVAETECQIQVNMDEQNKLMLTGCWPYQEKPVTLKVALKNPDYLAEQIITERLKSEGINLTGKVVKGAMPSDVEPLVVHRSKPLSELLKAVLQDSNNIYAESITKTLGAEQFQRGTFQSGILAIKEILKTTGIDFTKMKLYDGSGLSRYNLITPNQFARLLFSLYHDASVSEVYRNTLATFGESGTLKSHTINTGKIQAKTGSLLNVSTLSGYIKTSRQRDLIFVIMIDHVMQDSQTIHQFQDEFCLLLN